VLRANEHQTPDSKQAPSQEERETIVQSLVLLSAGGSAVSDMISACFDSCADVSLVDTSLVAHLTSCNNKLVVTPSLFTVSTAVGGSSPAAPVGRVEGLAFIDIHGNSYNLGPAYCVDLSHCSFDLLVGTPFLYGHGGIIDFADRTITLDGLAPLQHLPRGAPAPPPDAASGEFNINDLAVDIRECITSSGQLRADLEVHVWTPQCTVAAVHHHEFADRRPLEQQTWFPQLDPFVQDLCRQFPGVAGRKEDLRAYTEGDRKEFEMPIHVDQADVPKIGKAGSHRLSPAEYDAFMVHVQYLHSKNFISRTRGPVASPSFFVKKKDDTGRWSALRFVTDFRALNAVTRVDAASGPSIQSIFDQLLGKSVFSTMDFSSWFYQLPIRPEDRYLTAFRAPDGSMWAYNCCAFGLVNSPAAACRAVQTMFAHLWREVMVYVDDVLAATATVEEHKRVLTEVFRVCHEHHVQLSIAKCQFFAKRFVFLGHVFANGTRAPDPAQVAAVTTLPDPESTARLRSWLGVCAYLSDYSPRLAELTAPLQQLMVDTNKRALARSELKRNGQPKSLPLALSVEHKRCLAGIRKIWTSFPVLRLPNWSRPFVLVTDASKQAACSCLMQRDKESDLLLPIAFFSKAFSERQAGLAPYEAEFLAVYWSFMNFRHYLQNHQQHNLRPTVLCDHKPLAHLRLKKQLSQSDSRIVDYLSMFDYSWEWLPGDEMVKMFPNLLSRPYDDGIIYPAGASRIHPSCDPCHLAGAWTADHPDGLWLDAHGHINQITFAVSCLEVAGDPVDSVKDLQRSDVSNAAFHALRPTSRTLELLGVDTATFVDAYADSQIAAVVAPVLDAGHPTHHIHRRYARSPEGLLYLISADSRQHPRLIVPPAYVEPVISLFHDPPWMGHPGAWATYAAIREDHWFPGNMQQSVARFVRSCEACRRNKRPRHPLRGLLQFTERPRPDRPFDVACVDILGPLPESRTIDGHLVNAMLALLLPGPGWIMAVPCRHDIDALTVSQLYIAHAYPYIGFPRHVISDRGPQFRAALTKAWARAFNISWSLTTSNHQQASPVERSVQDLLTGLRMFANHATTDWAVNLPMLIVAANSRKSRARGGVSANELLFGVDVYQAPASAPKYTASGPDARSGAACAAPEPIELIVELAAQRQLHRSIAEDCLEEGRLATERSYNRSAVPLDVQPGHYVMVDRALLTTVSQRDRPDNKLRSPYEGPFQVTEVLPAGNLLLDFSGAQLRAHNVVNIAHCV